MRQTGLRSRRSRYWPGFGRRHGLRGDKDAPAAEEDSLPWPSPASTIGLGGFAMNGPDLKEARYWTKTEAGRVRCQLCPHGCRIAEGEVGLCRVRKNVGGTLFSTNYGRISAAHLDPIEKKPLFHFYPGSLILSLGTVGCNLACSFCQNWAIGHTGDTAGTRSLPPEGAVAMAQAEPGNIGLAYTYNEPFIWYEYVLETAELAKAEGLRNVLVTNGYVQEEPLRRLMPLIGAMNVDVKSMNDKFYRELCRGQSRPPRRTVEIAKEYDCVVEVTNLVIPNWNDSETDLRALVDWVASVDPEMPLHFSRYRPDHQLREPPTPADTLLRAREMARERLSYVYIGNLWRGGGENTECPNCGSAVVERQGFSVFKTVLQDGKCGSCGARIPIVAS